MHPALDEIMDRLSDILRWFNRHEEANSVTLFARLLRKKKVGDLKALQVWVDQEQA